MVCGTFHEPFAGPDMSASCKNDNHKPVSGNDYARDLGTVYENDKSVDRYFKLVQMTFLPVRTTLLLPYLDLNAIGEINLTFHWS